MSILRLHWCGAIALGAFLALAACGKRDTTTEAAPARPVRTVTVAVHEVVETATLTGHVAAEDEAALAFRIGGRMMDRLVNVGDHVAPGEVLAMLDPQDEVNALRSAQASLAAAEAERNQTTAAFERQRTLLAQGHTTRTQFDLAEKAMLTAGARVEDNEVRVKLAADRVSYTMLTSAAEGTVTASGAESGEVVQAGQMIVRIARKGGRDAVFGVPAQLLHAKSIGAHVTVTLAADPAVEALGVVREVAPQADPVTRTFQVKVSLIDPPEAMRLGSTVNGTLALAPRPGIEVPASALTEANRKPAVWIVDPAKLTVSLRDVQIKQFNADSVIVTGGLNSGDVVVTAGVQELHPGQQVRLLGSS